MNEIGDRNNTSFQYKLHSFLKDIKINEKDYLRYHQKVVVEYVLNYDNISGILLYHRMGSGKTMLSVAICEELINKTNKNIIFVSAKSLHKNFIKEYEKYNTVNTNITPKTPEEIEIYLAEKYTFISANAGNMLEQFKKAINRNRLSSLVLELNEDKNTEFMELTNSIIVWDEFHNFTNSVAGGSSKNATGVYDILTTAKNVKCIALTGTPIINDPFEISLSMNIFSKEKIFSDYYSDFNRNFVDNGNTMDINKSIKITNKKIFQDRIMGLVSYYGADDPEFKKNFPTKYNLSAKKILMSEEQFSEYIYYRDKEMKQSAQSFFKVVGRFKSSSSASSSYRVGSRQVSYYLYPIHAISKKKNEDGRLVIEKFINKITDKDFTKTNLRKYSPKIYELLTTLSIHLPNDLLIEFKPSLENIKQRLDNLKKLNNEKDYKFGVGSGIIYSQFVESGLGIIGKVLNTYGLIDITFSN